MSLETIQHLKTHLKELLETAENPKILWEEMALVAQNAFQLQAEATEQLARLEAAEQDIARLSVLFDLREEIWDLADKLAQRELEIKEKTLHPRKNAPAKTDHPHKSGHDAHACCCHTHDEAKESTAPCYHKHGCCCHTHKEDA